MFGVILENELFEIYEEKVSVVVTCLDMSLSQLLGMKFVGFFFNFPGFKFKKMNLWILVSIWIF
jgi:hypothetical protein